MEVVQAQGIVGVGGYRVLDFLVLHQPDLGAHGIQIGSLDGTGSVRGLQVCGEDDVAGGVFRAVGIGLAAKHDVVLINAQVGARIAVEVDFSAIDGQKGDARRRQSLFPEQRPPRGVGEGQIGDIGPETTEHGAAIKVGGGAVAHGYSDVDPREILHHHGIQKSVECSYASGEEAQTILNVVACNVAAAGRRVLLT